MAKEHISFFHSFAVTIVHIATSYLRHPLRRAPRATSPGGRGFCISYAPQQFKTSSFSYALIAQRSFVEWARGLR